MREKTDNGHMYMKQIKNPVMEYNQTFYSQINPYMMFDPTFQGYPGLDPNFNTNFQNPFMQQNYREINLNKPN